MYLDQTLNPQVTALSQDKNENFRREEKFRKKVCVWGFTVIQKLKMLPTVEYCTIYITVHTAYIVPSFSIKITSFNVLLRGTGYKGLSLASYRLKMLAYLIKFIL